MHSFTASWLVLAKVSNSLCTGWSRGLAIDFTQSRLYLYLYIFFFQERKAQKGWGQGSSLHQHSHHFVSSNTKNVPWTQLQMSGQRISLCNRLKKSKWNTCNVWLTVGSRFSPSLCVSHCFLCFCEYLNKLNILEASCRLSPLPPVSHFLWRLWSHSSSIP